MKPDRMKSRDVGFKLKALKDSGEFEGYGSVFGVKDSFNEVVEPGAFAESLVKHKREGTRPAMLWQHDPWSPIGVWDDLAEDAKGLYTKGRLLTDVQKGAEAHILLKAEAISGLSIGYRELEVEPGRNGEPRRIKKLDLLEVSIVSFPANRRARVDAVKGEQLEELALKWEALGRAVRDGEPPATKDFEDLLREAGIPKALACAIAATGYAKACRSDSGSQASQLGTAIDETLAILRG